MEKVVTGFLVFFPLLAYLKVRNSLTSFTVSPSESVFFISVSILETIATKTDASFRLLCTKNEFGILSMQVLHVAMVANHFTLRKCDGKGF